MSSEDVPSVLVGVGQETPGAPQGLRKVSVVWVVSDDWFDSTVLLL